MIRNYIKIAFRNLVSNKLYTVINISGLALGILSCVAIWVTCQFELSYENFQPDKENIYRVVSDATSPEGKHNFFSMPPDPLANAMRGNISGLKAIADFHAFYTKVDAPNGKRFPAPDFQYQPSDIIITGPDYFKVFTYQWLIGSAATAMSEPFKVVLTESKAYKYFGHIPLQDMVGKTLRYEDSLTLTVAGVVKDYAANSDFRFTDFVSISTVPNSFLAGKHIYTENWGGYFSRTQVFVKLVPGTAVEPINKQMTNLLLQNTTLRKGEQKNLFLQPFPSIHFDTKYSDFFSKQAHLPTLYGLLCIAAFILVIAVVNFINLSTVQSIRRSKEIGVRKVLGGSRKSLIFQLLIETFLITLAAMSLAVITAYPVLAALQDFVPAGAIATIFSWQNILMLLVLLALTTLLAGFYPAIVLSGKIPVISLKSDTKERGYLRKALVVFQFTISMAFIISTLVVQKQLHYLLHADLGFKSDAVININTVPAYERSKVDVLADNLHRIPGVELVSTSNGTPAASAHWGTQLKYNGGKEPVKADCQLLWIDENYVPLYQLKLVAGRNVQASDSMREFLINESAAKALGFAHPEDAIGKMMESGMSDNSSPVCPVVGVVADFHTQSLHETIKPAFFTASKMFAINLNVKMRGDYKTMIAAIGDAYNKVYPNEQFEYKFFDNTIAAFYAKEQKTAAIMNTATVMAILISCMGLLGLAAFSIRQRKKEIGLRKILGASVTQIVLLLTRNFILLVSLAILIATPMAWYAMNEWLSDFAYRINISVGLFLLAGALAIGVAVLTVSFQAVSAALVNPAQSIKTE
ncbi:ABC transporter permease [Chitinophaga sp.]|uniref:ABC transporter permease n=1 Tax=Chitinophaga sp. TaxID=1869181 RepID=UPI0031E47063